MVMFFVADIAAGPVQRAIQALELVPVDVAIGTEMLFHGTDASLLMRQRAVLGSRQGAGTLAGLDAVHLTVLARVAQIQRMLFEQWAVLETLTPSEYLGFREALGPASGFQSYQYRAMEFALGNKDANLLKPHRKNPKIHAALQARLEQPGLYDEFLRHLARRGHAIPPDRLERDFTQPYEASAGVAAVCRDIYEDTERYWAEYAMCEKLVDIEERFQLWRFRHMMTVKRIIGFRRGTGGSSGVGFLKQALDLVFFPELWDVRTELKIPPPTRAPD